ncbi:Ca2+:H+ antiporter [Georgenia satyanarayanai]|uniref:Ca2+:H+ antiporter n=1 Tax=Georgenia satyanarayanai TaxID=860221 RepID=A0A2Y9A623_9MICO|nr:calcium:proton antiporter [Georgenia satyanarayanai]PYG00492.1 Ca2+:H+ antiporter [Georgenia satyanarayanai]SSA39881.1 Ca2+:H+ antiporter [Georgenia satyanarayanai]
MSTARSILTPAAAARLLLGWGAVLALALSGPLLEAPVPRPVLVAALVVIVGVVLVCAFGVVHEAEHLARRLGDPYGSLVLTLSIVVIEVVLISAVMLGPGEHTTIARDSVMAVSMIILGLVVGLALLVGGRRHGGLAPNAAGASQYHSVLVVLVALALAVPAALGTDGSYTSAQAVPVVLVTLGLYAFFLARQTGAQAADFREVSRRGVPSATTAGRTHVRAVLAEHRADVLLRTGLLVTTVLPIVLLSHDMAALLDDGLGRLGAPTALAGVLIAMIVFLPESITAVRAALAGEIQRVSNLCHGALVSTLGLTIPTVLVIGMLTGQAVVLAESPLNLLLLGVSLLLSVTTFAAPRVTATHGAAHLAVFAVYAVTVLS